MSAGNSVAIYGFPDVSDVRKGPFGVSTNIIFSVHVQEVDA